MKKKMLFMAAIAGLVTLGSCVKDDVSGSVEAVRMAKANELNAKANEHNANAAVQNAAAALAQAIQSARVAQEQAAAQLGQANADIAKANAQLKAETLAAEIEMTLADYADMTATSNANVQTQLNNLANALRAASTNENNDVKAAITEFTNAFSNFTAQQKNVITKQLALDKAKNDSEHAAEVKEFNIDAQNKIIAQNEKKIELLNELKAKVGEGATKEDLQAAADVLFTEAEIEAAAFGETEEVAALFEAAAAWVKAYKAFMKFDDTFANEGIYAVLNNEIATKGWTSEIDGSAITDYYTASAAAPIKAGKINFGELVAFDYTINTTTTPHTVTAPVATFKAGGINLATVTPNEYTPVEGAVARIEKFLADHPAASAATLEASKKLLAEETEYLGKSSDTKDTKTAKTNAAHTEVLTVYAQKVVADNALAKAKTDYATAKDNKTKLPAAVASTFKDMWEVYDKTSSTDEKKATALYKFAKAVEAAFGEAGYNHLPANLDLSLAADRDEVAAYLFGNSAKTYADVDTKAEVEALVITGSTLFTSTTTLKVGPYDVDKNAEFFEKIDGATGRKAGAVDVYTAFTAAETALGTESPATGAYLAAKNAAEQIVTQTNKIADQKDVVAADQAAADNAEADVEDMKALIAAADPAKYAEAVAALKEASADYNEAVAAVKAAQSAIDDKFADAATIAYTNDIDDQILAAEKAIADAKQTKANWETTAANNADAIIAQAEADLAEAETLLAGAVSRLAAAQARIDALGLEIIIDDDDEPAEEPVEEPTEEPTEEPAEEETPAEP